MMKRKPAMPVINPAMFPDKILLEISSLNCVLKLKSQGKFADF